MPIGKICLDTETTGLDCFRDEIIELAIISYNGDILFHHRIKPLRRKSWPKTSSVNGIYPEDLRNEKTIEYYRKEIQGIFDAADTVIGYNVTFDTDFLRSAHFVLPDIEIDVMEPFAVIYGDYNDYWGDYTWQKLTTCARYYHYDWGNTKAHGALADALATLYCYKKILAHNRA